MSSGAVDNEHPHKVLGMRGLQGQEPDVPEEKPPIAPAVVLCLASVAIAVFGLQPWEMLTTSQSSGGQATSSFYRSDWRVPVQLQETQVRSLSGSVKSLVMLSESATFERETQTPSVPLRPPVSFKVAALSTMVFGDVQSDQWSVPATEFPEMMAEDVHHLNSAEWKPMISWRKSSSGETLLPVARVRCGGLSPQAVARRADKFDQLIGQLAKKYSVDENLVKAIITRESCFDQAAVSHVGAIGLMQLMPETARWLKVKNPAKAESNLAGGVKYFASLHKEFGSLELALAAYNAGPGNVRRYGGIPPFRETQSYVKTVLGFYRRYSAAESLISS